MGAWIGGAGPWFLALATAGVGAALLVRPPRGRPAAIGLGLLVVGITLGFAAEGDLRRFSATWDEHVQDWETRVQEHLDRDLDALLRRAEAAVERVGGVWRAAGEEGPTLPGGLVREGVNGVAVFGPEGELLAWDGLHQGPFPERARFGQERYLYEDGALFGYLYVTHPLPEQRGTAVAAVLLSADLPPGLDQDRDDFTSRFLERRGARIHISREDRVEGESVWDLRWEDRVLFSVTVTPLSEADSLEARALWWERAVALLMALVWLIGLRWVQGSRAGLAIHSATLAGLILILPLGGLLGAPELFSPGGLLLPGVPGVTLGHLLVLAVSAVFLLGVVHRERTPSLPPWLTLPGAILLGVAIMAGMDAGVSYELLSEGERGWVTFQVVAGLLVGLLFTVALLLTRSEGDRIRPVLLAGGLGVALVLAILGAWRVRTGPEIPAWSAVLWIVPLAMAALSLPAGRRWGDGVVHLALGFILAAGLTLPWAWSLQVEARMVVAEEEVERLGTRPDPFLEFLLLRAGEEARELAATGRNAVETLYGAWVRSGLAAEGVPVWLTVWSPDGEAQEELRIGVTGERPDLPLDLVQQAIMEADVRLRGFDLADVHYMAVAPLSRGAAISLVAPPRRTLATRSPLGPLFSPAQDEPDPLVLIPLMPGEAPGATEGIEWVRAPDGWQGELYLAFPDEIYHGHYLLELPGHALIVARSTLLLLLALGGGLAVWGLGRRVARGDGMIPGALGPWLTSFRGRVTLALFAFFLVPSVAFGTLAYQTLAGAAVRTAETLAERAVEEAASWYGEVGGAMDVLARRAGSDLLLYEEGELVAGSLPELADLGLYQGWLPPELHRRIAEGEELMTTTTASLGGWDYVVAYRRIAGGQVLAAPAPLQAGATALRQRDVADLIGFAVVLGAGLSVLLSFLVGRALTRPIQTLRVASERVGAGNMGVHLPEDRADEFGAVFGAFNRMVDRLGRTRRALIRSSRRTQAIMEEVATGVVALDPDGKVTLANPRAERLLGVPLPRRQTLPAGEGPEDPRSVLAHWVERYMRDGLQEAATELQFGDRRIRVRARRVSRRGPPGSAVVSLEDVTDELRTERILAWGEMARQVAHEVKNPLTPIKLGVQHIRRAWQDEHPDFDRILERNAEAILGEIERLARIASSFARFGAPSAMGGEPPEAVDVQEVMREVLALYQAGDGPVSFDFRGVGEVPRVSAREGELKEVLINLLENAREALPSGGAVAVEAEQVDGDVELRVIDDGVGIPEDLLPRIFEPHFSTRSGGSGLGLAIVRRLVESWGGRIWAESVPREGTTMTVRLRPWSAVASRGADAAPVET